MTLEKLVSLCRGPVGSLARSVHCCLVDTLPGICSRVLAVYYHGVFAMPVIGYVRSDVSFRGVRIRLLRAKDQQVITVEIPRQRLAGLTAQVSLSSYPGR